MKKIIKLATAFIILLTAAACTTIKPINATSNVVGGKVGESTCNILFGFIRWGDCSIEAAMKNGGLTKAASVDVKRVDYVFFATETTVVVSGR